MSAPQPTQADIDQARKAHTAAGSLLFGMVKRACPGEHRPQQHRDMKGPWCPACGRNDYGVVVKDVSERIVDVTSVGESD